MTGDPISKALCPEAPSAALGALISQGIKGIWSGEWTRTFRKWMAANRRESAGHSWEIYGDPAPDPADTETTVVYLLK